MVSHLLDRLGIIGRIPSQRRKGASAVAYPCLMPQKGKDIASAAVQLIEGRDALGPEAQSRLDNTFLQAATTMLQTAQRNNALAQLLIGNPGPVPKKVLADAAGLTSAEIARRDLPAKEKAERAIN